MRSSLLFLTLSIISTTCYVTINRSKAFTYNSRKNNYSLFVGSERNTFVSADDSYSNLAEEERLQKIIARAGLASRRGAESLILDGRVQVNGNIVTELGVKVKPNKDIILVDGKKVSLPDSQSAYWVALNKPKATLTTMEDEKGRETILNLIPKARDLRLVPIGRMERDSTGLILLTNEVGWIHPLTHPSFQHIRKYEVVVSGIPNEDNLKVLREGVLLSGETTRCRPAKINVADTDSRAGLALVDVQIEESLPLQVQRMMEFIGHTVISIKRTEFGPVKLKGLRKGDWRELTKLEVAALKQSCTKVPAPEDSKRPSTLPAGKRASVVRKSKRPGAGYLARQAFLAKQPEDESNSQRNQNNRYTR